MISARRTATSRLVGRMLPGLAAGAVLALAAPSAASASPGSPDGSFGSHGLAAISANTRFLATAVQSNGRVLAVGETGSAPTGRLLVARFTTSGRLDGSFGHGGIATGPTLSGGAGVGSVGNAVAIQPDGKIVVVGTGGSSMLIERFNANGTLDRSFGSGGVVQALKSYLGQGFSVVIEPNGKILAGGSGDTIGAGGFGPRVAVVALNANGTFDHAFAGGGQDVLTSLPQNSYALGLAPEGSKIVFVGSAAPGQQVTNALVGRLTGGGALDPSFAGTGYSQHQYSSGGAYSALNGVVVQGDGRIVAAGAAVQGGSGADQAIVARYSSSGSPDGSFGSGGVARVDSVSSPPPSSQSVPGGSALAIAGGDIVVAGTSGNGPFSYATVWAFNSRGALDGRFGSHGAAVTRYGANIGNEYAGIAVASNGEVVAAGDTRPGLTGASYGLVARYAGFTSAPLRTALKGLKRGYKIPFVGRRGLRVGVGCNQACAISLKLTINGHLAKRLRISSVIASGAGSLGRSGTRFLTLRLKRGYERKLAREQHLRVTLTVVITGGGHRKVLHRALTFTR